jgi:hypothetical protein
MPVAPLSVKKQEDRLRQLYPDFRPRLHTDWIEIWEGPLQPIMQIWRVRILYFSRRDFGDWRLGNPYVTVTVINPPIGRDPRGTGEPPPHVYRHGYLPDYPALCLFDPAADEWSPEAFIADTIVPWTIEWLFWFEVWLLTGEWKGGGRHPERKPCLVMADLDPVSADRRARFRSAEFHRIGRRIGAFASLPLMAAAFEGFSQPLSSRNWRDATSMAARSESISILSQEPQPEESSLLASVPVTPLPNSSICMSAVAIRFSRRCLATSSAV